jgi:uncharacterized membrane protein (UPF0127 family)
LEKPQSMLFILPKSGEYVFHMRNMKFDLNFICYDKNFQIIAYFPNIKKEIGQVETPKKTKYVLEIPIDK